MKPLEWIESYGGPLICMESGLKSLWGGIDRLTTIETTDAQNDYERACKCGNLLNQISLSNRNALVLGDHPLKTSVWRSETDGLFIIRLRWTEDIKKVEDSLSLTGMTSLRSIENDIEHFIKEPDITIFDSVESGSDNIPSIDTVLHPGRYIISTKLYEPNETTSLYIHQFRQTLSSPSARQLQSTKY